MFMYVRRIGVTNRAADASDLRYVSFADIVDRRLDVGLVPIPRPCDRTLSQH